MANESNVNLSLDDQIKLEQLHNARLEREAKELTLQIQKQTLEGLTLEQEVRKYHLKDLKASVSDREILEKQSTEDREQQGRVFRQQQAIDLFRYNNCTHKKGGMASSRDMRVLTHGGNSSQYSVMKHQMINGDIWVRCLRCGRTWCPPVEKNFFFDAKGLNVAPVDGTFSQDRFDKARQDYLRATMFETNNSMSTSVQCRFSRLDPESGKLIDAADVYRENISSTTLR